MNITTNIPNIPRLDTLGLALEGLKEIGKIIFTMAKIIGVIKTEIEVQELGDKALQAEADGITPEQFDTYADYVTALDNYITDPGMSQKISEELKEIKGVEIAVCLMVEKLVDTPVVSFIESIIENPEFFKEGIIEAISEIINEDKKFVADFVGYVSGTEKNAEKINKISDKLITIEKEVHPEISDKDAYKQVMQLRR